MLNTCERFAHHVWTINYALDAFLHQPHHKRVIDGQAVDLINATGLDGFVIWLVAGEMGGAAGGREGTGKREDDNALALEQVCRCYILPVEGIVATNLCNIAHTS